MVSTSSWVPTSQSLCCWEESGRECLGKGNGGAGVMIVQVGVL